MIYLCKINSLPILKIGFSLNPESRYAGIQYAISSKIDVIAERNGSFALEAAVHKACQNYRAKFPKGREWYKDCQFVRDVFFNHPDPYPEAKSARDVKLIKQRQKLERILFFGQKSSKGSGVIIRELAMTNSAIERAIQDGMDQISQP